MTEATAFQTTAPAPQAPTKPKRRGDRAELDAAGAQVLGHNDFLDVLQLSRRGGLALIRHQGALKVFKFIGCQADWKKRWARLIGWNPARRAVRMSSELAKAEIPVCAVEDHGTVSLPTAPRAVWTISRYVENGRTLRQLKEDLQPGQRSPQHAEIVQLFEDALVLLRKIHDAGFEHRDYHAGNLLVTTGDDGSHNLQLVDLETVMQRRATTLRRARDVRRFLENFVEPDDYREVIDRALELYAPDEPAMRAGILGTRRMQGLLKKRGERWDG
ncbi:MAG: hypothetical protein KDB82_08075 [Planctomycetes bacterium]|nr:hypothetical protein [Planctomycetota bacterium]